MTSTWRRNKSATQRVAQLLQLAGLPLELKVNAICADFCATHSKRKGRHVNTERLVYTSSSSAEADYREIDQVVQIYEEFAMGETGIQLITNMPIECKHRNHIEYFAFPIYGEQSHAAFPVASDIAGSQLFSSLRKTYKVFDKIPNARAVPVEIQDGETPKRVENEDLIHKAASALYDYVLFDLSCLAPPTRADSLINSSGVFGAFQRYLRKTRYPWTVLGSWMSSLGQEKCEKFYRQYLGSQGFYQPLIAHLPIICINGPLHAVQWSPSSGIAGFSDIDVVLSLIRKRGWPGVVSHSLLRRTGEVPTAVTNPSGLTRALELGLNWHSAMRTSLLRANPDILLRWPIEAALFNKVVQHYETEEEQRSYRSDLGPFEV